MYGLTVTVTADAEVVKASDSENIVDIEEDDE